MAFIILLKSFMFIMYSRRKAFIFWFTEGGVLDLPKLEASPFWVAEDEIVR